MPVYVATATPADYRQAVAQHPLVNDWFPGTSTGAGTTTTIVDSGLSGWGDNEFQEWYALQGSGGGAPGEWRTVDSFTGSTLTLRTANSVSLGNAKAYNLHKHRPDWYTMAGNTALRKLDRLVYRPVRGALLVPQYSQVAVTSASLPRNMRRATRIYSAGWLVLNDPFTRGNATTPGNGWSPTVGAWGITSNRLYCVSDTDGDLMVRDFIAKDVFIQSTVVATFANGSPDLVFRGSANDATNYLVVVLTATTVALKKVDASAADSTLQSATGTFTTSVDHVVRIHAIGTRVLVWVDDVLYIDYQLLAGDVKYAEYTYAGFRLRRTGASAAGWDDYSIFSCTSGEMDLSDWSQDHMSEVVTFDHYLDPYDLLLVDGQALASAMPAATYSSAGAGTLASDTTAVMEIATTDPAWELLVTQGVAELMRLARSAARSDSDRAYYDNQLREAEMLLVKLRETHRMPSPRVVAKVTGF